MTKQYEWPPWDAIYQDRDSRMAGRLVKILERVEKHPTGERWVRVSSQIRRGEFGGRVTRLSLKTLYTRFWLVTPSPREGAPVSP